MFNSDYAIQDNTPSDDVLTLKVSKRPVVFYQFLKYEKEKMYDYKYLLSKIQTISKKTSYHILFLKKKNNEELRIVSEADWNDYFFNNTIDQFIDSRNVLKIEFELTKQKLIESDPNEKTMEILSHYQSEVFMNKFLGFLNKNDTIQTEFYDYLMRDIQCTIANKSSIEGIPLKKSTNSINMHSPQVKEIMKKKFTEIQNKIILVNKLVTNVSEDDLNSVEEIAEGEVNGNANVNLNENSNSGGGNEGSIQPFVSYYDADKLNSFRSKIISDSLPNINLAISHYDIKSNNNNKS